MTGFVATVVLDGRGFLEAPHWHDGELWSSDLHRHQVIAVQPNSSVQPGGSAGAGESVRVVAELEDQPSGLGFLPDGSAIVVSLLNRCVVRLGDLSMYADLTALTVGGTNDMIVTADGLAYVGSFGYDVFARKPKAPGNLVLVPPDGNGRVVAQDLAFPNGMAITSQGSLLVAESDASRITEFDIGPDGSLSGRRVFAETQGRPDGIAIDVEDAVWVALPREGRFDRVHRGGKSSETITIRPGWRAVSCGFGGEDLTSLYLTTAKVVEPTAEAALEVAQVEVPGC